MLSLFLFAIKTLSIMKGGQFIDHEVARVHAKNKQEAIAALEHLIKTIKSSEYDGEVSEYVIVVNEGNTTN